ncbi:MAG: SRPBCC family protein [Hyphomicrobiales bacterium]|nr:SRPBCC family protein [Hyphomicrobiales bacterium]
MTTISLIVNGERVEAAVEPRTHLADFLREHRHLTGTHLGCEHGVCGACTVEVDHVPVRACITFAVACDGAEITTIEGFEQDAVMDRLRAAFNREHALQCGFCTPGMLIAARDIVRRLGRIGETRLRAELSGNLCRCTGYAGIVKAVLSVMQEMPADREMSVPRAAPPPPIARVPSPSVASAEPASALTHQPKPAGRGGLMLIESFRLPEAPDRVWQMLQDFPRVASCLPGVQLLNYQGGDHVVGRVDVAFGPISAGFAGEADVTREPAQRRMTIRGGGDDPRSKSRAAGTLVCAVAAEPQGGSRVDATIEISLTGPLAQFGRSGLIKALVSRLTAEFAANLRRLIAGEVPVASPGQKLQIGAVVAALARDYLRRIRSRLLPRA